VVNLRGAQRPQKVERAIWTSTTTSVSGGLKKGLRGTRCSGTGVGGGGGGRGAEALLWEHPQPRNNPEGQAKKRLGLKDLSETSSGQLKQEDRRQPRRRATTITKKKKHKKRGYSYETFSRLSCQVERTCALKIVPDRVVETAPQSHPHHPSVTPQVQERLINNVQRINSGQ